MGHLQKDTVCKIKYKLLQAACISSAHPSAPIGGSLAKPRFFHLATILGLIP